MARETVRIEGLAGVLEALKVLPKEMVSKAGGPVKHAAKAAANVLLEEAKRNVRQIIDTPNMRGEDDSTGLLLLSLRAVRTKLADGVKGEAISVQIKRGQKYPANRQDKGNTLSAVKIGRQLEYGTERRRAMPWMRPAFDTKKQESIDVFVREVTARTEKVILKLQRMAARR